MAAAVGLVLAATGCSSGSGKVLVQDSSTPALSVSSAPSADASTPAAVTTHRAAATQPAAASTATTASTPKPTASRASARTTPKPRSSATTTTAIACSGTGATTTIQMVTGDRFSPSAVTINKCDAVKAVYADSAGAPHNWQGKGWRSPDMSSSGQSYTFRFTSSGTFNFFCSYHQSLGMTGTVTVR